MFKIIASLLALVVSSGAFAPARPVAHRLGGVVDWPDVTRLGMVEEERSTVLFKKDDAFAKSTDSFSVAPEDNQNIGQKLVRRLQDVKNLFRRRGADQEDDLTPAGGALGTMEASNEEVGKTVMVETSMPMKDLVEDLQPSAEDGKETDTQKMLQQIKESGKAGFISYALWEWGFWLTSLPIAIFGYYQVAGHWPDFSNSEDMGYVGAEAFAFVNFARFAVPLRIGLALSTTGWVKENIVDRWFPEETESQEE